ncbi:MAG TPA: cryptochrome/photolyase family protein [Flavisolibacter sp.]|jgi:deoxyribodipyrimidine photolyase-related protein|nr:cryptochrome/photolyase family protein [Flavisolibacter sp.]
MPSDVTLIFPHQLYQNHPALNRQRPIYLVEEWLFFRQYRFHVQKLVLHRASMKFYESWLLDQGYTVHYIETTDAENDCRELIARLARESVHLIHMAQPSDDWLLKRIRSSCARYKTDLRIYSNPNFLTTLESADVFFNGKRTYFQTDFYIWQRKQLNLLLEAGNKPVGNKWTFDAENRKRFPKTETVPPLLKTEDTIYLEEARGYIQKSFPENYGSIGATGLFAVTFADSEARLDDFLTNRFEKFGIYEDAIVAKEAVLHHSVLTPMLNIGLLQPSHILEKALTAAANSEIPLNSLEGFIRQIAGWREFIHIVYHREGVAQRTTNFWNFKRKIPEAFWTGETGILPIDRTIKKVLQTGYCHHIERLMVLGSFMLLCEFDPDDVYRWFMELFIDAYDWVMVPNVYGMTQFADGGLMATKPYISGSNYLMKMGDYAKGSWQAIWDGLFWRFLQEHRSFFSQNPRLGMLLKTFDKMPKEKQQLHLRNANDFLKSLDKPNTV